MARHLLTAKQVIGARKDLNDGDGLWIRIAGERTSAVFRYTSPVTLKRCELGLGSVSRHSLAAMGETLTAVRDAAEDARRLVREGRDPVAEKKASRENARKNNATAKVEKKASTTSLLRYARAYCTAHIEPVRSTKHAVAWLNSIEKNLPATLLETPLADITPVQLLEALVPVLRKIRETGDRIYRRLSAVFDSAIIEGLIASNPCLPIKKELRRRAGDHTPGSYASMDYRKVPTFIEALQLAPGTAARCLELAILTASRSTEALQAEWTEFDEAARVWTIPAGRMKAKEAHLVYLSDRVLEILKAQRGQSAKWVFPTAGKDKPLSNMALSMTLRRLKVLDVTVHGFRSSFSTWGHECGIASPHAIEASLAHKEQDRVARAYNRGAFIAERRALMIGWANYVAGLPVTRANGTLVTNAEVHELPIAA